MDESLSFDATAPVAGWNYRIGLDFPDIFGAVREATKEAVKGEVGGAVATAIGELLPLKLEKREITPAELAWLLIRRALGRAMTELSCETIRACGIFIEQLQLDEPVVRLDAQLRDAKIRIDPALFDRPASLPIVDEVGPRFEEWLRTLGLNDAEAASVNRRLGAYFTFAVRREWAEHAEAYAPIDTEIMKFSQFAAAEERERAWIRNTDYLQRLIREAVFGETFGLERIYIPLRAWYAQPAEESELQSRGLESEDTRRKKRLVVDLEKHLDVWFEVPDRNDAVRCVCGGPGSGKTSFAKMWAAKLAHDHHKVIYIPLHRLILRSEHPNVQALLWEFLSDRGVLPEDPLDAKRGESRLLILFDGLDELAMQGQAGRDLARNFVDEVVARLRNWNDRDDRLVQVLLGGRDIAVEATRLTGPQVLHVLPYHGSDSDQFEDAEKLLSNEAYGCDRWWRRFGEAIGEPYQGCPEPLRHMQLAEITAQPLLNYLLALSYRRGKLDFSTAPNLNLIYSDLLDSVYRRRWGSGVHPTADTLGPEDFHTLLDELGLAAWHGAGRTVTATQVEEACVRAGLAEQLARFQEGARAGAISLLAAFYFRQAGKIEGGEQTFEFTHKSFGEYLTARRIASTIEELDQDRADRSARRRRWDEEAALREWCRLMGPAAMDRDQLAFFRRQIQVVKEEKASGAGLVDRWRETLAHLLSYELYHGLPIHALTLPTFQEMTRHARNAEEALLAAHFGCASAADTESEIDWPTRRSLHDLLARLEQNMHSPLARYCVGWLRRTAHEEVGDRGPFEFMDQSTIASWFAHGVRIPGLHIRNSRIENVYFQGAYLEGSDITDTHIEHAHFEGAHLENSYFVDTNITNAYFKLTQLGGAWIRDSRIAHADMELACLAGTHVEDTVLRGADFTQADLFAARFNNVDLTGARNLHLAQRINEVRTWQGTRLERKWVNRFKEQGLDLEERGVAVVDDVDEDLEEEEGIINDEDDD